MFSGQLLSLHESEFEQLFYMRPRQWWWRVLSSRQSRPDQQLHNANESWALSGGPHHHF